MDSQGRCTCLSTSYNQHAFGGQAPQSFLHAAFWSDNDQCAVCIKKQNPFIWLLVVGAFLQPLGNSHEQ